MAQKKYWRRVYGYRPSQSLHCPATLVTEASRQGREYFEWLAQERGWSVEEARKYAMSQPRCGLISAVHEKEAAVAQPRKVLTMNEVKTERPKPKLVAQAPSDAEKLKLAMELLELLVASAGQVGRRKIVLEVTRAARKLLAAESAARRRVA